MGGKGPTKQPTAIVKAKGYYRPSRYKDDVADSGALSFVYNEIPEPTERLNEVAKIIWVQDLTLANKVFGYISHLDLRVFEQYCITCSELYQLQQENIKGTFINDKGNITLNPMYKILEDKKKEYLMFCREFGFTPSSRSKITLDQAQPKVEEDNYGL